MTLTCQDAINKDQITAGPDASVIEAFKLIRKHGIRYLPIVDEQGIYLGVFTSPTLIRLLLPRAATINLGKQQNDLGIDNLSFFNINSDDFKDELDGLKNEKIIDHLSTVANIPIVDPNKGIMDGVMLLHNYKRHVILVEPETRKFIGVLTINSVLSYLFEEDLESPSIPTNLN